VIARAGHFSADWVTVTVLPAMIIEPVRATELVLGVMK
jgi:hypothetical protein